MIDTFQYILVIITEPPTPVPILVNQKTNNAHKLQKGNNNKDNKDNKEKDKKDKKKDKQKNSRKRTEGAVAKFSRGWYE